MGHMFGWEETQPLEDFGLMTPPSEKKKQWLIKAVAPFTLGNFTFIFL